MKRKTVVFATTILLTFLLLAPEARADRRKYVWTYEHQIMPVGKAELEHYFTFATPDIGRFSGNTAAQHQVELEFGMTDNWDFAVYQVFEQKPGEEFTYEGFKLRSRYKIGESGQYPVDTLVYLEYKNKPDFSEHELEFKLILARDVGRFNFAFNPVFEFKDEDEFEFEAKYAAGVSYEVNNLLSIGLELKGGESGHYFGPVISHGGHKYWVALGSAIKIGSVDEGRPEFQLRTIIGIEF